MPDTPNLNERMTAALQAVRAMDWNSWQPQPGEAWIVERFFGDQPPLTNMILQAYLSGCAWIWQRPLTPVEQQRATNALVDRWRKDSLALDYSWMQEIMSFIWALTGFENPTPQQQIDMSLMRLEFVMYLSSRNSVFPGIDAPMPGIDHAIQALGPTVPPSTLRSPAVTGIGLDGLYSATSSVFQFDIYGPPGSGNWVSQTELYAFFPDGQYLYFPSNEEAGAHLMDPKGHKAYEGNYEVSGNQIQVYDASNGQTHNSDFSMSPDGSELKFYGKTFTRIADTTGLRPQET